MNSDQKATMDKLSKLSGSDFDNEYMSDMVKDHEADAKEFENQANKGTDADIKAFAAKTLPMIQRHLQMARDVANQVAAK
jgi:putative membrane protein